MSEIETSPEGVEEDVDVLAPGTLIAIVDPLCGWCWGAAPAFERLAASGRARLEIVASGLFIGDRPMTAEFADYAWTNDQRIRDLTGQTFSQTYRDEVLGDHGSKFDSGPATLALTAVQVMEPEKALPCLHALQAARWVAGRDITSEAVCAEVLGEIGIGADTVAAFLAEDEALIATLNERATLARELLSRLGARGVPTLARVTDTGVERIDSRVLFENVAGIVEGVFGAAN